MYLNINIKQKKTVFLSIPVDISIEQELCNKMQKTVHFLSQNKTYENK